MSSLSFCRDIYTSRPMPCDGAVIERAAKRAERARNSGSANYAAEQIADTFAGIARENARRARANQVPAQATG